MNIQTKHHPLVITAAVCITILGLIAGWKLPNALLPNIDRPEIVLYTTWNGKGAEEIEQGLIAPLERQLSTINNLVGIESSVSDGGASTTLTFHFNADMEKTYSEVASRVNQVPGWPPQVGKPFIQNNASGAGATLASAMLYSTTPKSEQQFIDVYRMYIEPEIMKIAGVANVDLSNNPIEQRIDIEFNPNTLAQYSLTTSHVASVLTGMIDRSGQSISLGAKDYSLFFKGQVPLEELSQLPVFTYGKHIVRLGELASVKKRLVNDWGFASIGGNRAMYFMFRPSQNVNALDTIAEIKQTFSGLNQSTLSAFDMQMVLSRDDSKDIRQALELVYGNIFAGIALAALVLFVFLKNWRLVSLCIVSVPVCLSMVTLFMYIGGYSFNVISLAGMALSIGLLLDAAIIVVESILQFQHSGESLSASIKSGTAKVKGAIISSTLSSIIIFVPILMMQTSESQLFEDLAFTISSALLSSIVVAFMLIPTLARYILSADNVTSKSQNNESSHFITFVTKRRYSAWLMVTFCVPLALLYSYISLPEVDVLPNPKQRSIITFVDFNEPMNSQTVARKISQPIFDRIERHKKRDTGMKYDVTGMFCGNSYCQLYFYPDADWDYAEFKHWIESEIVNELPGTEIYTFQGSLLRYAMPDSRATQIDIKGDSLANLQTIGRELNTHLKSVFAGANISENSSLEDSSPRIEFTPRYDNLIYYGMSQAELNNILVTMTGGTYLGMFYSGGETLPFYLKAEETQHIDDLLDTQIMVAGHGLQPLAHFVDARLTLSADSIYRVNGKPTISLGITPPEDVPVGQFIDEVKLEISSFLATHRNQQVYISFRGSADRLAAFLTEFAQMFAVALCMLVLLMWLTLKSLRLAMAVMLSMPLAIAGGMLNLQILNLFTAQNLDVITLIGFIILLGLVINNAILLASQYSQSLNNGLSQQDAIVEAVRLRKKPIYMSTATSVFGMLPLMLSPGGGAEIYRGLAAVIIGGMTMSALLTLTFMSALLSLPFYNSKQDKTSYHPPLVENE